MKLIAKKGSKFESILREMVDKVQQGVSEVVQLVDDFTGVKPKSVARIFHWGIVFRLVPEFSFKKEDWDKIDPMVLRRADKQSKFFVPALRYRHGQHFQERFKEIAEKYAITQEALNEIGIRLVDYSKGISYYAAPYYNPEKDIYYMVCNDGVPRLFDKSLIHEDEFTISYEDRV